MFQIPERSTLPSDVLGARAERFGLPSRVRGMPDVGYFSHCAESDTVEKSKTIKTEIERHIFVMQSSILRRSSATIEGANELESSKFPSLHNRKEGWLSDQ